LLEDEMHTRHISGQEGGPRLVQRGKKRLAGAEFAREVRGGGGE